MSIHMKTDSINSQKRKYAKASDIERYPEHRARICTEPLEIAGVSAGNVMTGREIRGWWKNAPWPARYASTSRVSLCLWRPGARNRSQINVAGAVSSLRSRVHRWLPYKGNIPDRVSIIFVSGRSTLLLAEESLSFPLDLEKHVSTTLSWRTFYGRRIRTLWTSYVAAQIKYWSGYVATGNLIKVLWY